MYHGELRQATMDLPLEGSDTSICESKGLPVHQRASCPRYLTDEQVLRRADEILTKVAGGTELEIDKW